MLIQPDGLSSKNIKKPIKETKRRKLKTGLFVCLLFALQNIFAQNLTARIKIDVERKTGKIDSLIW